TDAELADNIPSDKKTGKANYTLPATYLKYSKKGCQIVSNCSRDGLSKKGQTSPVFKPILF
ncbi:hypothetical protein, partial [Bacillus haynesii]|uniref:hypothetical protein n=1 Tax=Bacillus haynesii TaxID=1925021 RepID=UPI0022806436